MLSTGLYSLLILVMPNRPPTMSAAQVENLRGIFYTIATAGILSSVYWTLAKLSTAPDSARFLIETVIATALSQICVGAGIVLFVLAHKGAEFWPFAATTLAVQGLFILPRALQRD